jgi:hypothetical protein
MRLIVLLLAIVLVGASGLAAMWVYQFGGLQHPKDEIFKSLLQFVVVGMSSLVVSLLVAVATRREDTRKAANEIVRTAIANLNKACNDTKGIRRSARAQSVAASTPGMPTIGIETYDTLLRQISEIQLSLELVSKFLKEVRFHIGDSGALDRLNKMENCLDDMRRNHASAAWEDERRQLRASAKVCGHACSV